MTINDIKNNSSFSNYVEPKKPSVSSPSTQSFASIHEAIKAEKTTSTASINSISVNKTEREEKIAALKNKVNNGTYSIDSFQIANSLVKNNII